MRSRDLKKKKEPKYKIVRMYYDERPSETIKRGLTLEEAQRHCRDPNTREKGVWFDGYDEDK